MFSRLEVTLGLLVSGFLVTHLSAADRRQSDGFFLKRRQRYVLRYWEAEFCFDCCHVGLQSLRYVSLLGANHSHSGILLIASTLMNEKKKKKKGQLVEIGRSRRELLIFSGRLWISKAFPRKRGKEVEFPSSWMEPLLITADLTLAVFCYSIYWDLWMKPVTH